MSTFAAEIDLLHEQFVQPRRLAKPKRGRAKENKKLRMRHFFAPMLLFVVLVIQLSVRICILEKGYRLEELRRETLQNDAHLRQRRLDYAFMSRPTNLARSAERRLGMTNLTPQQIRKLDL